MTADLNCNPKASVFGALAMDSTLERYGCKLQLDWFGLQLLD